MEAVTETLKAGANIAGIPLKTGKIVAKGGYKTGKSIAKKLRRKKRDPKDSAWDSRVTAPFTKLELVVEGRRLPRKDSFSHADSFCVLWEVPPGFGKGKKVSRLPARQEKEVGRTEVVRATKDPKFQDSFNLEFYFQLEQTYIIRIYDEDLAYSTDLIEHDFIGGVVFTLGEVFGARGSTIARPVHRGKAFLILKAEEIVETREVLEFRFSGQNLDMHERKKKMQQMAKRSALEKFTPFFKLERYNDEAKGWDTIWRSEVIIETQNPTWNVARLPLQLLCDEPSESLKIAIWDKNRTLADDHVGDVNTTVAELVKKSMRGIPTFEVMLEVPTLFRGMREKKNGELKVLKADIVQIPNMLQYVLGGCELELTFAVDCTLNNEDWRKETSLHFHSPTKLNDYQAIIQKIVNVSAPFNASYGFSLWGYGGQLNGANRPYFVMKEHVKDADTLLRAYEETFDTNSDALEMGRKADLSAVIQAAMSRAIRLSQKRQSYSTLVILTAGDIANIQAVIDTICTAAEDAPISIAAVIIGDAECSSWEDLMGDDATGKLRNSNKVPIARDVFNLTSVRECGGNISSCAAEALSEIPEQFVQYFLNCGVTPMPPLAAADFTVTEVFGQSEEEE